MTPFTLAITLFLMGCYLIVDGIGSIIEYWRQHWYEHAVRVGRTIIGVGLILFSIWMAWQVICVLVIR